MLAGRWQRCKCPAMADGVRISMRLFGCSSGSSSEGSEEDDEATESDAESAEVGVDSCGCCLQFLHHKVLCNLCLMLMLLLLLLGLCTCVSVAEHVQPHGWHAPVQDSQINLGIMCNDQVMHVRACLHWWFRIWAF